MQVLACELAFALNTGTGVWDTLNQGATKWITWHVHVIEDWETFLLYLFSTVFTSSGREWDPFDSKALIMRDTHFTHTGEMIPRDFSTASPGYPFLTYVRFITFVGPRITKPILGRTYAKVHPVPWPCAQDPQEASRSKGTWESLVEAAGTRCNLPKPSASDINTSRLEHLHQMTQHPVGKPAWGWNKRKQNCSDWSKTNHHILAPAALREKKGDKKKIGWQILGNF